MTAETGRETGVIPPIPASLPAWSTWLESISARMGEARWTCPEEGCPATFGSAAYLGDHLTICHNWTETELRGWWTGDR